MHVGTVSELVHQGLHLDDDYRLGRNTLLEQGKSRKAEYDLDIRSQEEKLITRNKELDNREAMRQLTEHRAQIEQIDKNNSLRRRTFKRAKCKDKERQREPSQCDEKRTESDTKDYRQ